MVFVFFLDKAGKFFFFGGGASGVVGQKRCLFCWFSRSFLGSCYFFLGFSGCLRVSTCFLGLG